MYMYTMLKGETYFKWTEEHSNAEEDEKDNVQGKKLIKPDEMSNENYSH